MESRCLRSPGAATAITTPRHYTRLACPTHNQATSPPHQAPFRHLSHSSQIAQWKEKLIQEGDREGTPRTAKVLKLNPQFHANRAMNMLQAHGTTTHKLTKNTAGQCQPQGSHGHMTAANAIKCTNAKQMLIDGQDASKCLQKCF